MNNWRLTTIKLSIRMRRRHVDRMKWSLEDMLRNVPNMKKDEMNNSKVGTNEEVHNK